MSAPLTPNTQAILLLTAPLIIGRSDENSELLTLSEYNRLARLLREKQKQPADLIGSGAGETTGICAAVFGRERLEILLGRSPNPSTLTTLESITLILGLKARLRDTPRLGSSV